MKRLNLVLVLIAVVLSLGGTAAIGERALDPEKSGSFEVLKTGRDATGLQRASAGGAWYRDEYGRMFSIYEPRHNVVRMGLLRGEYPTWILAADQKALGMTNAAIERMGYISAERGNWQSQTVRAQ